MLLSWVVVLVEQGLVRAPSLTKQLFTNSRFFHTAATAARNYYIPDPADVF